MIAQLPTSDRLAMTYREVANALGLSERTIWGLVASGQLNAVRIGRRSVRILREELDRFLASQPGAHSPVQLVE